jgi:hypothetical protein
MRRLDHQTTPGERRAIAEAKAAQRRAQALALRDAGMKLRDIGARLRVSPSMAQRIVFTAQRLRRYPRWHDKLPQRAVNFLSRRGLKELPESDAAKAVAMLSRADLLSFPNLGRISIAEIETWLARHGLVLAPSGTPLQRARRRAGLINRTNGDFNDTPVDWST